MGNLAIKARNISKLYHIGETIQYRTLRDSITSAMAAPGRWLMGRLSGAGDAAGNRETPSDTIWALRDVSFDVPYGKVLGIIGANGAGKSTLLKILARITEPTEGRVEINGRVASLLEVGTGFHPELTGRENIFLNAAIMGMKRSEIKERFDEIVAFSEIEKFLDTPVKRYSSGMYTRLAFSVAAHLDPEVLLIDEVLAVGDAAFQKKCLGKMDDVAREGRTVLFVSHNMGSISSLCSSCVVLSNGSKEYDGNTQEAIEFYMKDVLRANGDRASEEPHVIYTETADTEHNERCRITKVEILDTEGRPKELVYTWDSFVIRVHFESKERVKNASVVIEMKTLDGIRVLVLSTQPDGTYHLPLEPGQDYVDCIIEQPSFSAGEYVIGAGLAIPRVEYLWRKEELGRLHIQAKDVYECGLSPTTARSLLAVRHKWARMGSK